MTNFYILFDPDDYNLLIAHQRLLHNKEKAMTFDEQRDYAERLRLLLLRAMQGEIK
jgi:hypothetical protein